MGNYWINCRNVASVLMVLFTLCLNTLHAQSQQPALVVVSKQSQAECVNCIGGQHIHVESMFGVSNGPQACSYKSCEARIQRLLDFRVLVISKIDDRPTISFWHERMAAANPKGAVCSVSDKSCRRQDAIGDRVKQINEIHRILVSVLPQYRDKFDANLNSELKRLKRLQSGLAGLALRN